MKFEFAPSKLITEPERYLISFSMIDFTKLPISSGFPSRFIGSVFAYSSTLSISSLVLSVSIGPGAILRQLICLFAYSLPVSYTHLTLPTKA